MAGSARQRVFAHPLAGLRNVIMASLLATLAACSSVQPLPVGVVQHDWYWPLPATLLLQVVPAAAPVQDYLLVLQDEQGVLRASLFDPAGMPVARKQLHAGRWRNEGLLPPHAAAQDWLTAIVRGLTADSLPAGQATLEFGLPDGSLLQVRPLESP